MLLFKPISQLSNIFLTIFAAAATRTNCQNKLVLKSLDLLIASNHR